MINIITAVFIVVVAVVAVVTQQYWVLPNLLAAVATGTVVSTIVNAIFCNSFLGGVVSTGVNQLAGTGPGFNLAGECGGGGGGGGNGAGTGVNTAANTPQACWQVPVTLYIPNMNQGQVQQEFNEWAGLGGKPRTECSPGTIDETKSDIVIYRLTTSNNSNLNDWYLNQIKTKVGNGYLVSGYHTAATNEPWLTVPYSKICSGNVCKFNDDTIPDNSYVVYAAKVVRNYYNRDTENLNKCTWPDKFLNKDNSGSVTMPSQTGLGNAFDGPYNIGACPPKVDLKINGDDTTSPYNMYVPNTKAELKWTSQKVKDCVASEDWSGAKAVGGTENLGKLERGTSDPGKGKKYAYNLSCKSALDGSKVEDSVSATVFKWPDCTFTANPDVIKILPATSTLSWNCRYLGAPQQSSVDSCSISPGIGNLTQLPEGSMDVRPSQETTYTLSCSSIDKTTDYQTSVKVGFKPRVKEIIPK